MINYSYGNIAFLDGVCDLLKEVKKKFKIDKKNIYQTDDYPNKDIFKSDLISNKHSIVALDGNKVVGFICFEDDFLDYDFVSLEDKDNFIKTTNLPLTNTNSVSFSRLMVDPKYRKQGIGSNLFKKLENEIHGKYNVIMINPENNNVLKLYKDLGYKDCSSYKFVFGFFYLMYKYIE